MDDMVIIHAGDLGMLPSPDQILSWKPVDILMVPVGGIFTINGNDAQTLVDRLHPLIAIPMHYQTSFIQFELHPVEDFLRHFFNIKAIPGAQADLHRQNLPTETEIWVFQLPE
jgi:L-ascorbate metabolism protein UlaG (beta-lactamase superfamily)